MKMICAILLPVEEASHVKVKTGESKMYSAQGPVKVNITPIHMDELPGRMT